jgi:hypothetical protein
MAPKRRIFWMVASSVLALAFSRFNPEAAEYFLILGAIWTVNCAIALLIEEKAR